MYTIHTRLIHISKCSGLEKNIEKNNWLLMFHSSPVLYATNLIFNLNDINSLAISFFIDIFFECYDQKHFYMKYTLVFCLNLLTSWLWHLSYPISVVVFWKYFRHKNAGMWLIY